METSKQAPWDLQLVAALFFLSGVFAVIEVLVALTRGSIYFNFTVLGIFICWGLLRFSRGWRTCALVFTWLGLILLPLFALPILGGVGPIQVKLLGQPIGHASAPLALSFVAVLFALAVWQYRVLTRPDVVELFYDNGA